LERGLSGADDFFKSDAQPIGRNTSPNERQKKDVSKLEKNMPAKPKHKSSNFFPGGIETYEMHQEMLAKTQPDKFGYELRVKHLQDGLLDSYRGFDKAILALSSGGLGLTVLFLQKVIMENTIKCRWQLILSWVLFVLTILCNLISFLLSVKATEFELLRSHEYYIERKDDSMSKKNKWQRPLSILNIGTLFSFIAAVVFTFLFSISIFQVPN
jgi:hypothetical protein